MEGEEGKAQIIGQQKEETSLMAMKRCLAAHDLRLRLVRYATGNPVLLDLADGKIRIGR